MRIRTESIICPQCGACQKLDIYETVNIAVDPSMRDRVASGELFRGRCETCGCEIPLSYDCVYKDIAHRFMIYLIPPQTPNAIDLIESAQKQCEELLGKLRETFCLRIVSSVTELQEKRVQFEQGLDDRITELYKTILLRGLLKEQPEYRLKQALLTGTDGKKRFFFTDADGNRLSVGFDEGMYRSLEEMFLDKIAPFHDNYFSVVNLPWAHRFLDALNREGGEY